jgi:phosphoribosylamine--glycine ligase
VRTLVVGGGGREHALCRALVPSSTVFCAPGNPGTAELGTNVALSVDDHDAVLTAVRDHAIDLTVIGPEAPLAAGLVDRLVAAGHRVFGPTAAAARLEASKAYAKEVMTAAGVPTARAETFTLEAPAIQYIESHAEPLVVKASGLAAGKGAIVCASRQEATAAVRDMFAGKFGAAGDTVVIEDFLEGEELSILALTDGEHVMLLPASQDHKRIGEGDTGPNTGGMGAYTPVSIATDELLQRVLTEVLHPVLRHLAEHGTPYRGVLYAGLMMLPDGAMSVLEFNCRFGDPEAQVVLPALGVDLAAHMWAVASGESWVPSSRTATAARAAVTTVLAAEGYPGSPTKGAPIAVPETLPDDTVLYHAGTTRDADGVLRTAGGRVLSATGLGATVAEAATRSRELAEAISFDGRQYRRDIAWREAARAGAA